MALVLSGPVHGGKTTFLERRLPVWAARGLGCGGFLSPAVTGAGGLSGYDLLEIATGRRHPYLRAHGNPKAERVGPYVFVPETLERARTILREASPSVPLVVDEVGPLELAGGGLWTALEETLRRMAAATVLVVREGLVSEFAARLAPHTPAVIDIRDPAAADRLDDGLFGKAGPA
jgi:iron complex transport system ATP-binding protein